MEKLLFHNDILPKNKNILSKHASVFSAFISFYIGQEISLVQSDEAPKQKITLYLTFNEPTVYIYHQELTRIS